MNELKRVLKDNRGITLVELLATLVIVSIIGTLAYSVLAQGYSNYQRIQVETELRDEADLIMSSLIKEVFLLKNRDIAVKCSATEKETYIGPDDKGSLSSSYFTGFKNNQIKVDNREIQSYSNNIAILPTNCNFDTSPTLISESSDGSEVTIRFTLSTKKGNKIHDMKFENTLQVINDSGGGS